MAAVALVEEGKVGEFFGHGMGAVRQGHEWQQGPVIAFEQLLAAGVDPELDFRAALLVYQWGILADRAFRWATYRAW